jgi:two-component system chemotaxis response regulator CheY
MDKIIVICIDDQRDVLAAVQKDLSEFDSILEIMDCESAAEAEELIEDLYVHEKPIGLIICDHIMPEENGIDFLTRLQKDERFKNISTILLTGLATHMDTIEAINKAHISNYVEKPWQPDDLKGKIKVILTRFIIANGMNYTAYNPFLDQETLLRELKNRNY